MAENRTTRAEVGLNPATPIRVEFSKYPLDSEKDCYGALCHTLKELARFIDHSQHCEPTDATIVGDAGHQLLNLAVLFAHFRGVRLAAIYGERLDGIERKNSVFYRIKKPGIAGISGAKMVKNSSTWQEMQTGQMLHDNQFHPYVFNNYELWKADHYTIHIAKLPSYFFDHLFREEQEVSFEVAVADLTAFGMKLITEFEQQELSNTPIPA